MLEKLRFIKKLKHDSCDKSSEKIQFSQSENWRIITHLNEYKECSANQKKIKFNHKKRYVFKAFDFIQLHIYI